MFSTGVSVLSLVFLQAPYPSASVNSTQGGDLLTLFLFSVENSYPVCPGHSGVFRTALASLLSRPTGERCSRLVHARHVPSRMTTVLDRVQHPNGVLFRPRSLHLSTPGLAQLPDGSLKIFTSSKNEASFTENHSRELGLSFPSWEK